MIEIRKTLLVTGAVISFVAPTVLEAAPVRAPLVLLAQADATDAVASAQAAVAAAQAALRAALASGSGVDEARAALAQALQALEQARLAAGLPPSDPSALQPVLPEESAAPPAAEQPQPPPPPADQQPAPPPAAEQPPVVDQTPPPPAAEQTPPAEVAPVPPPQQKPPRTKPAVPPANIQNPPPPVDQTQPPAPPPADQVVPPPPADQVVPPPSAEQTPPPATGQQPPATTEPSPVVNLPPPVIETPPPPPPPAATQQQGTFDLNKFQNRPKFGAVPPAEAAKEPPPAALPSSEAAVKDGAVIQAQDGRVIVKEGGQVTVKHDDSGRFVRQGDQLNTQRTGNDTETTTVTRPDGSQIVTVRDKFGNIIQRYRKNPNGSVDVLIGDMEQPGIFGRIFGQGPQPAPPRPRPDNRPPIVNLNLGPIQLNIPQQDYIVESSRANRQQLEQTLLAPPVERVERTYTLEEIRQNGRLRDKVRRIDFDTITFDTAQATVPDDQIAKMQTIGTALRDIIQRDPTQVFLIEGHTDAVGSDLYNLALSDRRAETVAQILSYYYGIPAENLVTQGYGEQFLKVPTTAANRDNRRVAFRNITPLMRTSSN
jgi:outer membrane protein OmpA-like peptidoglycan-associated protein